MKTLLPYYVERYKRAGRRSRLWAWVKAHPVYVALQALLIAMAPGIFLFSAMLRGYQAIGSEAIIIVAPSLYKGFMWLIEWDERRDDDDLRD